jgi:hypothetical protein
LYGGLALESETLEAVYPTSIPVAGENRAAKFIFSRSVAIFTLEMLQEDDDEALHIDFNLLSNYELAEELCAVGAIRDELLGGVVDDGLPNGFINVK